MPTGPEWVATSSAPTAASMPNFARATPGRGHGEGRSALRGKRHRSRTVPAMSDVEPGSGALIKV
jgi:hypothetical protein